MRGDVKETFADVIFRAKALPDDVFGGWGLQRKSSGEQLLLGGYHIILVYPLNGIEICPVQLHTRQLLQPAQVVLLLILYANPVVHRSI